ncbi:LysM domain-containing protein [Sphingorhabdus arenilitoris]|uniref:LysM domain-containing protein n=1 Tax=Sphingorhabdus arenilitoris TaxID=1490041 RepID=A0ABV8RFM4_9SPHN
MIQSTSAVSGTNSLSTGNGRQDVQSYQIQRGDTLSSIAARFGTDARTIAAMNAIANPNRIYAGQSISVPAGGGQSYTVRSADTLGAIARANGLPLSSLIAANPQIANPNRIFPGDVITIPARSGGGIASNAGGVAATSSAAPVAAGTGSAPSGPHRLGSLSETYESGGRGPGTVSSGRGDPGGVSYGVYQLSTNAGTLQTFMRNEGSRWAGELRGLTPGSGDFSAKWRAIAEREPQAFRAAQHAFIERTHYQPVISDILAGRGIDLNARHNAVRDAVWSVSVQHAGAKTIINRAVAATDAQMARTDPNYDRALVQNIYAERSRYVLDVAQNNSRLNSAERAQLRDVVRTRYPAELRDAMAMFNRPQAAATSAPAALDSAQAATADRTNPQTAADFAAVINSRGDAQARSDLAAGNKVVVAIRTPTSTNANGGAGRYDDRMAVVWRDGQGNYQMREFNGNTDPSGRYDGRYGRDMNGDGRRELGQLVTGNYRYERQAGTFVGNRFFRATESQSAIRDVNHDGRFDSQDRVDRSGVGTSMLFHQGGNNITGSAGCQTLKPSDYNSFLQLLGSQRNFSYVLI